MGKRSDFKRRPQDDYPTPLNAVLPLLKFLPKNTLFAEPCCGEGKLVKWLHQSDHVCTFMGDISSGLDALDFVAKDCEYIITNPPWTRSVLHRLIPHFSQQRPTWLLFDADWMHTKQASPYLPYCEYIVSVGRVSWMENGVSGKDNCCWYKFIDKEVETKFIGRRKPRG